MSNLVLKKSSFIHIPKCGGTYIQALLYRLELVHLAYNSPSYGHLFLHQMLNSKSTYNFTFIRHPYTWWPSFYNWSKKDRFSSMERKSTSFDEWIVEYGPFWMGQYTRLVQRYTGEDPLYKSDIKINFVGKMENMIPDLFEALSNAKENISIDRINEANKAIMADPNFSRYKNSQEYENQISKGSKEIIYNSEKYIFDKFNYSKDL